MEHTEFQKTVYEALKGASRSCMDLSQYILKAGNCLRVGEIKEGNDLLMSVLDDFGELISLLEDITQCQDLNEVVRNSAQDTISNESETTIDILKMAYEAQENQDWVYLADILEYELSEKLETWNSLFSGLSKIQQNSLAA